METEKTALEEEKHQQKPLKQNYELPGTPNNHFLMDVWWNNHFPSKGLESSNWNNHL